ncbi:MAG: YeeE/YedE family protein [Bacteroidetes bacterium]|nr:YeeE/YedE family protein [Bacteroidota bacterium]
MGPLIPQGIIGAQWDLVIAVLIGMAFGFVLESSGFSSSRKLAGVFYGYDFTVLRVFFTAAITAIIGLVYFSYAGWIDLSMIFVNPTFVASAIIGGAVMGLGFIMGGYCPGTSFCGAAIGKIDAMFFTIGMFIGIFIFSEGFSWLNVLYESGSLGPALIYETIGISRSLFVLLLVIIALVAFFLTARIQKRVKKVEY